MHLITKRFELRALSSKALDPIYYSWLEDPEITRYLNIYGNRLSRDEINDYVDSHDGKDSYFFAIYDHDQKMIGTHSYRFSPVANRCVIGGMIGEKNYWGRNVILETRAGILDYAFRETGCFKAEAGCHRQNIPAVYNFARQGWAKEGVLRSHRTIQDEAQDLILFGMLKKEWNERQ